MRAGPRWVGGCPSPSQGSAACVDKVGHAVPADHWSLVMRTYWAEGTNTPSPSKNPISGGSAGLPWLEAFPVCPHNFQLGN